MLFFCHLLKILYTRMTGLAEWWTVRARRTLEAHTCSSLRASTFSSLLFHQPAAAWDVEPNTAKIPNRGNCCTFGNKPRLWMASPQPVRRIVAAAGT